MYFYLQFYDVNGNLKSIVSLVLLFVTNWNSYQLKLKYLLQTWNNAAYYYTLKMCPLDESALCSSFSVFSPTLGQLGIQAKSTG